MSGRCVLSMQEAPPMPTPVLGGASPPSPFHHLVYKLTPANGADDVPINPTLTWQSSPGTSYYEYCYNATINSTCNATWTSAVQHQRDLSGLQQLNPV